MARIMKLAPEQEQLLGRVRDEWIAHGLSTQPTDRAEAERGARLAYEAAGLAPPRFIVWLGSPFAGALGRGHLPVILDQVRDQVDAQVDDQVRAQVRDQVRDQVHAQVDDQVRDQVHAQVRDQVRDQVDDQVDAQVRAQVDDQVHDRWYWYIGGGIWAGYYAYFDAMRRLGCENLEPIQGQQMVAKQVGYWWALKDAVLLTDRPERITRDDTGRLHNEDGAAVLYRDGWGVYAWHGTRIPETHHWIINEPDRITAKGILDEPNAELRRVMLERFGYEAYARQTGMTVLDDDEEWGTLWRADKAPDDPGEPLVVVQLVDSTPTPSGEHRNYWLRVPPDVSTARAAVAWQFGFDEAAYDPAVQT